MGYKLVISALQVCIIYETDFVYNVFIYFYLFSI